MIRSAMSTPDDSRSAGAANAPSALISVRGLSVDFMLRQGPVAAVRQIDFDLGREKLGIVGESGSGKSVACRALLGLVAPPGRVTADRLALFGEDFRQAPSERWRAMRGVRIGLVMQDPRYSLNPVQTVGAQMSEALMRLGAMSPHALRSAGLELLEAVKLRDPLRVWAARPHELSGGMGQRVMIAMMLAMRPDVLIADEPTSALDVTVAGEILDLLDALVSERGMSLILISHDLRLVQGFCDRVLVMYAGRILETCQAKFLEQSTHPYTRGLLECVPSLDRLRTVLPTLQREDAWRV